MLQQNKLDELFEILEEARSSIKYKPEDIFSPRKKFILINSTIFTALIFFIPSVFALYYGVTSTSPTNWLRDTLVLSGYIAAITTIAYPSLVLILFLSEEWKSRKDPLKGVILYYKFSLHKYAAIVNRLQGIDKETLEYGLLQYRHTWSRFDRLILPLIGEFPKIGLFPAFFALAISADKLINGRLESVFLPLVAILGGIYIFAFIASLLREKPDQIIALLEHAIKYSKDPGHQASQSQGTGDSDGSGASTTAQAITGGERTETSPTAPA